VDDQRNIEEGDRTASVLFVDDETDFLDKILKRIRMRKIEAFAVNNGKDALEFLKETPVDVVVLDLKMPGMDGMKVLTEIKNNHPLIEVIMLTGHADVNFAMEGMQRGAFDYLTKPIEIEGLLHKIQDAHTKKSLRERYDGRFKQTDGTP